MIVIYAEKEDMGKKIAAALDSIYLDDGTVVPFSSLASKDKAVSAQGRKDGYFAITFKGQPCRVTWGWGHMCGLKEAADYDSKYKKWQNLPVPFIPASYEVKPVPAAGAVAARNSKQLGVIKTLFDSADLIINSTDADREGELIFAYVYQYLRCRVPYKRALFSEQSQSGIIDAFDHLYDSSDVKNVEMAGRARNIADSLVGWNLTAQYTLHNHSREVLSIGRVQTALLNIIVTRELAIKKFKPEDYFTVEAEFTSASGETYKGIHQTKRFDDKTTAAAVLSAVEKQPGEITDVSVEAGQVAVPELFNQDVLQMECNDKFGLNAKDTLSIAQFLYDNGYTTYPRTSSRYLTEDMRGKIDYVLDQLQTLPEYTALIAGRPRSFFTKRFFDNKKVKSHFAIIPTGVLPTKLDPMQQKVYDLICRSVIRMIYDPAKIENTKLVTTVNGHNFLSSGRAIIDPGWCVVTGLPKTNILPKLVTGDKVSGEFSLESKQTKPPQRYTDKTLIKAMITAGKDISDKELRELLSDPQDGGIGTTATRAGIIETIIQRQYVERNGKQFVATNKGIELIQKFPVNDLKSAEITAQWEKRLNMIADGKDTLTAFVSDITSSLYKWCDEIKTSDVMTVTSGSGTVLNCPLCGKPVRKVSFGWGCSGYKDGCKFTIGTICGKKLTELQVKQLIENKRTNQISGFKSKAGKTFRAALCLESDGSIKFDFGKKKSS